MTEQWENTWTSTLFLCSEVYHLRAEFSRCHSVSKVASPFHTCKSLLPTIRLFVELPSDSCGLQLPAYRSLAGVKTVASFHRSSLTFVPTYLACFVEGGLLGKGGTSECAQYLLNLEKLPLSLKSVQLKHVTLLRFQLAWVEPCNVALHSCWTVDIKFPENSSCRSAPLSLCSI